MTWTSFRLAAKVPVSGRDTIVSDPLVADDAIYAGATFRGDVVKLARNDLREIWRIPSEQREAKIIYDKTLVLPGFETIAIHADTRERLWSRDSRYGVIDWKGKLLLQQENQPPEVIDPKTGATLEVLEAVGKLDEPGAICGDVLLVRTPRTLDPVRALSLVERRILWERRLAAEILGPEDPRPIGFREPRKLPLLSFVGGGPNRIVVTAGGKTLGCSLEDGRILWRVPVAVHYYWPNVHHGRVYVLMLDRFIAIDEATGGIIYEVKHPELRGAYRARRGVIYGDRIAMANESGHLAVFDLKDGSLVWLHTGKIPLWATAEADGRLLVSTGDGKLLVFADKS